MYRQKYCFRKQLGKIQRFLIFVYPKHNRCFTNTRRRTPRCQEGLPEEQILYLQNVGFLSFSSDVIWSWSALETELKTRQTSGLKQGISCILKIEFNSTSRSLGFVLHGKLCVIKFNLVQKVRLSVLQSRCYPINKFLPLCPYFLYASGFNWKSQSALCRRDARDMNRTVGTSGILGGMGSSLGLQDKI